MTQNLPTETQEACTFAEWCEWQGVLFSHVPQETFTKSWAVKHKNTRMGVRKGVPDYVLILPASKTKDGQIHQLWIELKRQRKKLKSGKYSTANSNIKPDQQIWVDALNRVPGNVHARICYGADESIQFCKEFLI